MHVIAKAIRSNRTYYRISSTRPNRESKHYIRMLHIRRINKLKITLAEIHECNKRITDFLIKANNDTPRDIRQ